MRGSTAFVASALAAMAAVASIGSAQAAACANFNGFFIGGNVGVASHDTTWTDRDNWADRFTVDIGLGSVERHDESFELGLEGGYNYQPGCALIGGEIEWSWADAGENNTYTGNGDPTDMELRLSDDMNWFGTIRGRAGVVVDRLLLYVTAGGAFARISHNWRIDDDEDGFESFGTSDTRWGWTGGGGAEWDMGDDFSAKVELLYLDFGSDTTTAFSPQADEFMRWDNIDSLWVGRVGVTYRFENFNLGG